LKPKQSAFFAMPLALPLEHLDVRALILTGLLADCCILLTAQDAHLRSYTIIVPPDCLAARHLSDHHRALAQLRRGINAGIRPAADIHL
jgi:nicotinamidase-related amidase